MSTYTYYTSYEHLLHYYDKNARKYAFNAETAEDCRLWEKNLRKVLTGLTGLDKMETCALSPSLLETTACEGYTREKWLIQTEPDVWMPFYILIPNSAAKIGNPCIIAPHGHGSCGKEGVANTDGLNTNAYGTDLVRMGYIVFCPDARGSGERRELREQGEEHANRCSCNGLNMAAISLGQSLIGMWVWDLSRLLDFIQTDARCNGSRIGCCGFSGGGLQTLWLTALDTRIKSAVISGYFHSYRGTLLRTNQCGCNFVPHLWEYADIGDIGALIAPRPLLIESGDCDPLNGEKKLEDVQGQIKITRGAYRVLGAEEQLRHKIYHGAHRWYGHDVAAFLQETL